MLYYLLYLFLRNNKNTNKTHFNVFLINKSISKYKILKIHKCKCTI